MVADFDCRDIADFAHCIAVPGFAVDHQRGVLAYIVAVQGDCLTV